MFNRVKYFITKTFRNKTKQSEFFIKSKQRFIFLKQKNMIGCNSPVLNEKYGKIK